jgi:hypothetical protein
LNGFTDFTLSMIQDADFVTNQLSPHLPTQGLGLDQAQIAITAPANYNASLSTPLPDLTVTQLQAPTMPLTFGQSFQVVTTVKNQGNLDAGPFTVRYMLAGTDGSLLNVLFLKDTTVNGLKAGASQTLVQTLTLPSKLPDGQGLNPNALGQIAVVLDPENTLNESNEANNSALSNDVSLQLPGMVSQPAPTTTTTATTTTATTPTPKAKAKVKITVTKPKPAPKPAATKRNGPSAPKHTLSHNLKVFPNKVEHFVRDLFKK